MFTYYQAENSTAEPALVNAIEQGLRAEHGVVTEDDILMELTKWVEASDNGRCCSNQGTIPQFGDLIS